MNHQEKMQWLAGWAMENGVAITLEGECGFGRECVGMLVDGVFPDYEWHDDKTFDRLDSNGDVWTPEDAYHKHPCVAVLGRGEESEAQLYDWIKWFDDNGFSVDSGVVENANELSQFEILLDKHKYCRMVKSGASE